MAWDREKTEQELFAENEYLIRHALKKLSNPQKADYDDLYQEGAIALLSIIRKYKHGDDIKSPRQYATLRIFFRMNRYLDYQSTTVHVSRRMQSKARKQGSEKELLENAKSMSLLESWIIDAVDLNSNYDDESIEEALAHFQIKEIVETVNRLPENRKRIMCEYFKNGMDVKLTAEAVGCTTRTVYRARAFLREKVRYLKIFDKDDV